ncbi:MAG: hypothetical protein ACQETV_01590 [Actinomycetota bacterium]
MSIVHREGARASALAAALALAGALLSACEPVEEDLAEEGAPASPSREDGAPEDLAGMVALTDAAADEWVEGAVVVEVVVPRDAEAIVRTTYVAPDTDRLLVVEATDDGLVEQQPTFETLGFSELTPAALESVPDLEGLLEPDALPDAAEETIADCEVGEVDEVLYTTGAPAAWDGAQWTSEPAWEITVLDPDGNGAVLDGDGDPREDPCIAVEAAS